MVEEEKIFSKKLIGKTIVTKSGKKFGVVGNITFDTKTGELIDIVVKNPTPYIDQLNIEQNREGKWLIPFSAVIAIGDFVVVSEEELA